MSRKFGVRVPVPAKWVRPMPYSFFSQYLELVDIFYVFAKGNRTDFCQAVSVVNFSWGSIKAFSQETLWCPSLI